MKELFTNENQLTQEMTDSLTVYDPLRGTQSYTVVLEFFVKTIRINMSLN